MIEWSINNSICFCCIIFFLIIFFFFLSRRQIIVSHNRDDNDDGAAKLFSLCSPHQTTSGKLFYPLSLLVRQLMPYTFSIPARIPSQVSIDVGMI